MAQVPHVSHCFAHHCQNINITFNMLIVSLFNLCHTYNQILGVQLTYRYSPKVQTQCAAKSVGRTIIIESFLKQIHVYYKKKLEMADIKHNLLNKFFFIFL